MKKQHTTIYRRITLKRSLPFFIIIVVLLYLGLNAWIYFYGTTLFTFSPTLDSAVQTVSLIKQQGVGKISRPTPTTIVKPVATLPGGKQSWEMSHGPAVTGPKIDTVTVDPLTPKIGDKFTVTITARHDSPITAQATLVTDNKKSPATMKKTAGADTDGTWETSFTMDDSYNYTYSIDFTLKSATGEWTGALTLRK